MKVEFEKLLDAIGSLEDEKQMLENELERAKKEVDSSKAGQSNASSAAAKASIERMTDRFLKVT